MPPNDMNIAIVLDSSGVGGIETHILNLAIGLNSENIRNTVVFLNDYGSHPLEPALNTHKINYVKLSSQSLNYWVRTNFPNIIHTHGYKAGILGRIVAKINRIPVVSTHHAGEPGTGKLAVYMWLDRMLSRLANANIAVSEKIKSQLGGDCVVLPNFVNVPEEFRPRDQARSVGFVGRLSHEKGPDIFVKLATQLSNMNFKMFGGGPMLETLASAPPSNLEILGQVNMDNHWQDIDLLVMPSRHEGLPMAALEAMARGIPLACFGVGQLPNLIDQGINGWHATPGNFDLLKQDIKKWMDLSSADRKQISESAREKIIENYAIKAGINQLLSVYNGVFEKS